MKMMCLALMLSGIAPAALAQDDPSGQPLMVISAKNLFVPVGFDDNDQAQAVVDGYMPSTCYRVAYNEATFDPATKTYQVTQYARKVNSLCLNIPVPYFKEVNFGLVSKGDYKVTMNGTAPESLSVTEAPSSGPDDFLYAPIDNAHVVNEDGHYYGVLEGRLTSTCMQWGEIKVMNHVKTIEVLPTMKMADDAATCQTGEFPFSQRVALPDGLPPGRHLMHVRSLNGQAVNTVYTVE